MTQDTIEKPAEKSMAALAEILREHGVTGLIPHEMGDFEMPKRATLIFRCDDPSQALEIADIAIKHDYPLWKLLGVWRYDTAGHRRRPLWEMRFDFNVSL